MAEFEFGKLDFSTSFNPTSAFPIDARCLFADYESALAAANTAEMPGSKNTKYYIGQKLLVVTETTSQWYKITSEKTLEAEGSGSSSLPAVSEADESKVLTVKDGEWVASELSVPDGECQVDFASDEEVETVLDTIDTGTTTDREDGSEDNTFDESVFATDEEVSEMLDGVFGTITS